MLTVLSFTLIKHQTQQASGSKELLAERQLTAYQHVVIWLGWGLAGGGGKTYPSTTPSHVQHREQDLPKLDCIELRQCAHDVDTSSASAASIKSRTVLTVLSFTFIKQQIHQAPGSKALLADVT